MRRFTGVGAAIAAGCILAACSSTPSHSSTASTTSTTSARTTSTTGALNPASSTSSSAATSAPATTSSAPATAQNLTVTDSLRSQLLQVAAAMNNVPLSGYTGLAPGQTYYAYDPATATYWAGAALVPSASSTPAQVSVQDDGSYILFSRSANGAWTGHSVGATGEPGTTCAVPIPASIVALWGWPAGTCKPPGD